MTGPPAAGPRIERVSTLELFFDLVFVFTITQLTAVIGEDPTWRSALRAAVMLAVIFWMYGGYAWLTNAVAADTAARRVVLLAGMAGFFIVALAVPRAFDGGGLAFDGAYAVVVVIHIGLFSRAASVIRFAGILALGRRNGFMVILVSVGGALGGDWQLGLWAAAATFAWIITTYTGTPAAFTLGAAHFVERHGLVVLVAIGESVVAIGIGLSDLSVDPALVAVAILGLGLSTCLWWAYFHGDDTQAEHALANASPARRSMMAIEGYGQAHLAILLGIVAIAAAEEPAAHDPFEPLTTRARHVTRSRSRLLPRRRRLVPPAPTHRRPATAPGRRAACSGDHPARHRCGRNRSTRGAGGHLSHALRTGSNARTRDQEPTTRKAGVTGAIQDRVPSASGWDEPLTTDSVCFTDASGHA